ncbi:hypothetical protein [Tenacibaculum sp. nBUS_03]|uniref:hypothetical protein n=1 Tax=Tenacibaculum sp. nBUS_03 TaxID=3395320 RepID=UPI003EBC92FC
MLKKLIILFVVLCFSCKTDSEIGFKGKWVNTKKGNDKKIIVISRKGEKYTVNINRKEKFSAFKENGALKIIMKYDTIESIIDNNNFLIIRNETFKKLNDNFSNPGAGNY